MRFVVGGVLQLPLFAQQCCANYARLAHRSIYFDSNFDDDRSLGGWMDGWIEVVERMGGREGSLFVEERRGPFVPSCNPFAPTQFTNKQSAARICFSFLSRE